MQQTVTVIIVGMLRQRFEWAGRFQKVSVCGAESEHSKHVLSFELVSTATTSTYRLRSYLSTIRSRWSCVSARFGSHRPSHVLAHVSLPCDRTKSISSLLNVAIDIDLTRCGGVMPRLVVFIVVGADCETEQNNCYCCADCRSICVRT